MDIIKKSRLDIKKEYQEALNLSKNNGINRVREKTLVLEKTYEHK